MQEEILLLQKALQSLQEQQQLSPEEIAEALASYQDRGPMGPMGLGSSWGWLVFCFISLMGLVRL